MNNIFVFGASGHAKVVIDIIEKQGLYKIAFLADDNVSLKGSTLYGYSVVGGREELLETEIITGIVAIGSNNARSKVASWMTENGFGLITAIHPSACVARGVTIGSNSVIMAGAIINSDCSVGSGVIINTKASVDHDCLIGNDVHIAPGATLCGAVTVGDGSFVCAGATIIPNLTLGKYVTIGAGATVITDIVDGATAVGNPAKIIRQLLR